MGAKISETPRRYARFFCWFTQSFFQDVVERVNEHGEYLESQFMGFHMITFLSKYFGDNSNITEAFLKRFKLIFQYIK